MESSELSGRYFYSEVEKELGSVVWENHEFENRDGSIFETFVAFVVHLDANAEKELIVFLGQCSLKSKILTTATLVKEVKPEKRWVWTLKFVNNNSIWVFFDYQNSNGTNISIIFESKRRARIECFRLKPWSEKYNEQ